MYIELRDGIAVVCINRNCTFIHFSATSEENVLVCFKWPCPSLFAAVASCCCGSSVGVRFFLQFVNRNEARNTCAMREKKCFLINKFLMVMNSCTKCRKLKTQRFPLSANHVQEVLYNP